MKSFYEELGKRIRHYRNLSGLTLEELGKRVGVGKSTVRKYEVGDIKIDQDRLRRVADALGIDVALLYGEEIQAETVEVPLYGSIACGNGTVIYEEQEGTITTPTAWVNKGLYFYLTAKGDSMTGAKIHEGDLLLIKKQETVENGEIAAVVVEDQCLLKRVYRDEGNFTLISENTNYAPINFKPTSDCHIKILGKLTKAITTFD